MTQDEWVAEFLARCKPLSRSQVDLLRNAFTEAAMVEVDDQILLAA